jgi:hypothetical protein
MYPNPILSFPLKAVDTAEDGSSDLGPWGASGPGWGSGLGSGQGAGSGQGQGIEEVAGGSDVKDRGKGQGGSVVSVRRLSTGSGKEGEVGEREEEGPLESNNVKKKGEGIYCFVMKK